MTEEEFNIKNESFIKTNEIRPNDAALFNDWGSHYFEWANEHVKKADNAKAEELYIESGERYQQAISLDSLFVDAYENLSLLNAHLAELNPDDKSQYELETAIINLGAGSAYILNDDLKNARECLTKSFDATKETSKISIVPFTFMVGIDFMEGKDRKKIAKITDGILPTCSLSGYEETEILCRALSDGRSTKALKGTLTSRAAQYLADKIIVEFNK